MRTCPAVAAACIGDLPSLIWHEKKSNLGQTVAVASPALMRGSLRCNSRATNIDIGLELNKGLDSFEVILFNSTTHGSPAIPDDTLQYACIARQRVSLVANIDVRVIGRQHLNTQRMPLASCSKNGGSTAPAAAHVREE